MLAAVLVAVTALIAAPGLAAAAQTRIGLNGGRPSEWSFLAPALAAQGLTQEGWLAFASRVGENWLPGTMSVPVDYPAQLGFLSGPSALTADQSTAAGQRILHDIIMRELEKGQPVAVTGLSEGTLVVDQELTYLQNDPNAPPAQDITFYVFGDMLRGLGQMYLRGLTIPFIGQTFGPLPESQYDTVVVNEQWDGWANPPDRPWNLLAVLNAVMGAVYTVNGSNDHSQTSLDSMSDAVKVSETTNSRGGTTTTYMIPRQQLPLTRPLRQLGVPGWAVDELDKLLMPWIQAGYSTLTPNLGPHVAQGQLVFTSPPAPAALPTSTFKQGETALAESASASSEVSPGAMGAVNSPTATAPHEATAASGGPSKNRQSDRQPADVASLKVDPQSEPVDTPRQEPVQRPTESDDTADADRPDAATTDATGSIKDDPGTGSTQRPRLAPVDRRNDSDGPSADRPSAATGSPRDDPEPAPTQRPRAGTTHGPAGADSGSSNASESLAS